MKKSAMRLLLPAIFSFLAFLNSCASSNFSDAEYLEKLDSGNYEACRKVLNKKTSKKLPDKDLIRDLYDEAMISHFQKDYDSSLKLMNRTDRLMDDAVTKSITKGFASFFANDRVTDYAGNPYEYMYINIFNALNYYGKGDLEEAAVEVRRLNEKQQKFINDYGEWLKKDPVQSAIEAESQKKAYSILQLNERQVMQFIPPKPTENDIFRDSPTARYLSIVFGMMDSSLNNSWNVKADAETLHALNASFDVDSEINISNGKGRLDILAFSGLIGRRGEKRLILGPFPGIVVKTSNGTVSVPPFDLEFVYPVFPAPQIPPSGFPRYNLSPGNTEITKMPENNVEKVKVVFENGNESIFSLLEDFNYAVQKDVNSKARKAFNTSVSRSLIKKSTAVTGSSVSLFLTDYVTGSALGSLLTDIGTIFAFSGIEQLDKTELADIRQVYALPSKAHAYGIELLPGKYSFRIQYLEKNGKILWEEKFSNIEVKYGKTTLVESLCQK